MRIESPPLLGAALLTFALFGCRDERNRDIRPEPPAPLPAETPGALGGGPSAGGLDRYDAPSALDAVVSAECHRAQVCSFAVTGEACVQAALAAHGEIDLAHCPRGVAAGALSNCARVLRDAPCDVEPAQPDSCRAAVLCPPGEQIP